MENCFSLKMSLKCLSKHSKIFFMTESTINLKIKAFFLQRSLTTCCIISYRQVIEYIQKQRKIDEVLEFLLFNLNIQSSITREKIIQQVLEVYCKREASILKFIGFSNEKKLLRNYNSLDIVNFLKH